MPLGAACPSIAKNDRRGRMSARTNGTEVTGVGRRAIAGTAATGRFLRFTVRRFLRDRCFDQAASLSYTTLLSLVPFVALCVVVLSVVPQFRRFVQKAGRLTGFGVVGLALSAALLLAAIDMAFDTIWRVHRRRSILVRLLAYGAILALGPILIGGSLSLQGFFLATGKQLAGVAF